MMRFSLKSALGPLVLATLLSACAESRDPGYMYPVNEFRIFYDLEGSDALPEKNQVDRNDNSIPDYVENIANRLVIASSVFTDQFMLQHPLSSERYRNQATYIDVVIKTRDGNGSAGDAITRSRADWGGESIPGALWIHLSTDLSEDTLTPPHELFHLFQNGYTMFKNRWFTEGTARWVQYAFEPGTGSEKRLPGSDDELNEFFDRTYSARFYWRRLFRLLNPDLTKIDLNISTLSSLEGYPEIGGIGQLYGINFMRGLLQHLDQQDDIAAKERELPRYRWGETLQKSSVNNPYIVCAILKTITEQSNNSVQPVEELSSFIGALRRVEGLNCGVSKAGGIQ